MYTRDENVRDHNNSLLTRLVSFGNCSGDGGGGFPTYLPRSQGVCKLYRRRRRSIRRTSLDVGDRMQGQGGRMAG